jgi:dTDP-4-dehydrorhamnose reductase
MRIAITGAGGFVGRVLARRLSERHEVIALNRAGLDVTDAAAAARLFEGERPEVVINCAVVGVEACERDPPLGRATNRDGARNVAAAAARVGAEVLQVSTNHVFGGRRARAMPYTVEDDPHPPNEYGRTKLAGERAAFEACPHAYVVRTSWVFGSGKENFFSTVAGRLRAGERVRAVGDVRASATYVEDFAARVEEILSRRRFATYHAVNRGVCSYREFAREAARLLGLADAEAEELIEAARESEMRRAPRPRYAPLRCLVSEKLDFAPMRHWRDALADFLRASAINDRRGGG